MLQEFGIPVSAAGPDIVRFVGGIVNLKPTSGPPTGPLFEFPGAPFREGGIPAYPRMRSAFGSYIGLRLALAGTWTPPTSMVNSPDAM